MKTIETLKKEIYWMTLYDFIEDELEKIRKANGWRTLNDARYNKAMKTLAERLKVDVDDLKEYYEDD